MKVIFEYNRPEDNEEIELHMKTLDFYCALVDMRDYLRGKIKYEELSEKEQDVYEKVADKFFEIITDRSIDL